MKDSILLKASDIKLLLPKVKEADISSIVPTSSTTMTLVLGDSLCAAIQYKKKFSKEIFKRYHKGGSLGKNLLLVKDIMTSGKKIPTIDKNKTIGDAAKVISAKKLGLVLVMKKNKLISIATDGDCRRGLAKFSKNDKIEKIATKSISEHGTGGMKTKIDAAKVCQLSGCHMAIASGLVHRPIQKILSDNNCTWFLPNISKLDARKKWIISSISPKGDVIIDDGALNALRKGKSLLAAGIKTVRGNFNKGCLLYTSPSPRDRG